MPNIDNNTNRRILVVDDNEAIHKDFRKVLEYKKNLATVAVSHSAFFGEECEEKDELQFELDSAFQGMEALEKVRQSVKNGQPYAMAFVDIRMPPGWDGIETIGHLWKVDPNLLVVICTAYNDYNWKDMARQLGCIDHWQVLKKPFDSIEVRQLAASLTEKWTLARRAALKLDELQQMVEQRTKEIEQARQQLLQSQKLEAVGTLAGGVAHEFNNLLQIVTGYTHSAIANLPHDSVAYDNLSHVLTAADKAARLTSGLLGFSRQQLMAPESLHPNNAVAELVSMLRPVLGQQIELVTVFDDRVRNVHADPAVFQKTLMDLCLNARDAMPSGGRITLTTEDVLIHNNSCGDSLDLQPGHYVRVRIADIGCGMTSEVQQRMFDPFFTTKQTGQGTGLGLAMVYGNVQQLGGTIECTSTLGEGTEFTLMLPTTEEVPADVLPGDLSSSTRSRETEGISTTEKTGGTILVVDDEPILRKYIRMLLSTAGYETIAAADGEEAVSVFQKDPDRIGLVLLDVVMPGMGGHEAYQRIKQIRPEASIIICSGYAPKSPDIEFAEQAGLRVIRKPFKPAELLQTVSDSLKQKSRVLCVS